MRHKMDFDQKRNRQIGIKVQNKTRKQLEYIAGRESCTLSTLIDNILKGYINNYLNIAKINWDKLPEEERGEE